MRVTRSGEVMDGTERIGWVNRERKGSKWRGVKQGGREKTGFSTRAEAVEWVREPTW